MKDEEFEKRLELILSNLYKIDHEVREYIKNKKANVSTVEYDRKLYLKNKDISLDGKYGSR